MSTEDMAMQIQLNTETNVAANNNAIQVSAERGKPAAAIPTHVIERMEAEWRQMRTASGTSAR